VAITGLTIVRDALLEHGVVQLGTSPAPEDADFVLDKLNRIIDNWNAERGAVYCETLNLFTLIPNHGPHTIGPTGDFVIAQRPVTIERGSLFIDATVQQPIDFMHDYVWWALQTVPALTSTFPTDAYYEPDWPNGQINFWPIGTGAQTVTLTLRTVLAAITLASTFSLPPGYQDAITLTLAEDIATAYRRAITPTLMQKANEARGRIFANNRIVPMLTTQDSGMPHARPSSMNYRTREIY